MGRAWLFVCLALTGCSLVANLGNSYEAAEAGAPMADSGRADSGTATDAPVLDAPADTSTADVGAPDATLRETGGSMRVFLSSTTYNGALVPLGSVTPGVTAANTDCQALATQAQLGGTWVAWLSSDGTTPLVMDVDGGWSLVGGAPVASSLGELLEAGPATPINVTEGNKPLEDAGLLAWTGFFAGEDCNGWADPSGMDMGVVGDPLVTTQFWSDLQAEPCTTLAHLYCFEQ